MEDDSVSNGSMFSLNMGDNKLEFKPHNKDCLNHYLGIQQVYQMDLSPTLIWTVLDMTNQQLCIKKIILKAKLHCQNERQQAKLECIIHN